MASFDTIDSKDANTNDLLDVITRNSDEYPNVTEQVSSAVQGLSKFYAVKSTPSDEFLYQYDHVNQHIFDRNSTIIHTELSNVLGLLKSLYRDFYSMDNPTPYMPQPVSMPQPTMPQIPMPTPTPQKDEKKPILQRLFSGGNKKEISKDSPYNSALQLIKDMQEAMSLWYGLLDYHAFGQSWQEFYDYSGAVNYLNSEIIEFKRRVPRILTAIDGGLRIGLDQEKAKAGQILATAYQATERHRMDFDPNQQ